MVVRVLCAAGPNGRGVFYVRLGALVCVFIFGRVSGGRLGVVALARSACGLGWAPVAGCVFCVWSSPVARCVASPSCGVYFAYGRGLFCGA